MASLDNGKYGLVYPSGVGAIAAILHMLKAGDHIVSGDEQYGGTHALLLDYTKMHGIDLDFVDCTDLKQVENALKPNTKVKTKTKPNHFHVDFFLNCFDNSS